MYATGTIMHDGQLFKPGDKVPDDLVDNDTMDQWEEDGIVSEDEPDEVDPGVHDALAGMDSIQAAESATPKEAFGKTEVDKEPAKPAAKPAEKAPEKPAASAAKTESKSGS